ncbi:glycosyltransferase family 1 protein [Pleomassaria siparia CBS 279.74]|uniref:Glycosyltransferase family 1 protein n=1 Tax=Pleomassaria siparia CBS 279.74 TaxID=1314801 RepID=A0A6G1KM14_9PLEO|nr:glycosyltransferase family 1 protein [Pleomassaria siparia CBS 279.74]
MAFNKLADIFRCDSAEGHHNHHAALNAASHHDEHTSGDYEAPPAYTEMPGQITDNNNDLGANAVVCDDGRVNISINQKSRRLSQLFVPQLQRQLSQVNLEPAPPPPYVPEFLGGAPGQEPPPSMNVVIMVVGSRGDVQPFVALGKVLKETYGHRIRLATHPTFQDFVTENGLEFFSIGGDPAELMAFMVKNPGLMPGFDTLRSGDVGQRRKGIGEILRGTWRACIETGDGLNGDPLKHTVEEWMGVEDQVPEQLKKPFVADAIIANPPSFGHVHCAEKLGIPLHMMFTMPWSPTQQFPHPLANIQSSNADASITNFMSYTLVDMLTWQGLGDVINKFRRDSLGLEPISMIWAPGMLARMKIPYTYCWSPALIPKPKDWGHHISISGFYFLSLAQNFTPEPALAEYLAAGEPPVYIGFGSIVVDDPNAMTKMIFEAVKKTGRRALVSKGWGGLGADELGIPEGVFMLGNVPHDWLFKHVSAVVHHGGAGTTAAGIAAGRPTVVIPFFGDQPFWGAMTAKAGAGPLPIPYKELTADKLAGAINEALKPESLERAQELSQKISKEQGGQNGAQSFHQMLRVDDLRCAVAPKHPAVWRVKRTQVRLSALAATILCQEEELTFAELKLFRPREYETDEGPWDPISGGATAIIGTATTMMMGVADLPIETLKLLNIHPENKAKGKSRVGSGSEASSRTGRERRPKPATGTLSASSSESTLPGIPISNAEGPGTPDAGNSSSSEMARVAGPGTPTRRTTFMSQAMAASTQFARSPSQGSGSIDHLRHGRVQSGSGTELRSEAGSSTSFSDRLHGMNAEAAVGTGKGIGRIVGAGFKSPLDFTMNVSKGFHNVPKLLGGDVRQVDKVTDLQSGIRTAAKELGFGLYEGLSGLVTDPIKGAKKEGGIGFVKGVGRGIFSFVPRMGAGFFGVPAYVMKGLYQEAMKGKGANLQNYIIAARISQGYDEASNIPAAERADIISQWKCIRLNIKKKKNVGEDQIEALHTLMNDRKKKRHERLAKISTDLQAREGQAASTPAMSEDSTRSNLTAAAQQNSNLPIISLHHADTFPRPAASHSELSLEAQRLVDEEAEEKRQMEAAIAASVAEASRGNPEEDEIVAKAIRASIAELQRPASHDEDEEEALQRAINASIEEADKSGASVEEKKTLEETLRKSLLETGKHHSSARANGIDSDNEWDTDYTEDDEDFQRMVAESEKLARLHTLPPEYAVDTLNTAAGAQESGILDNDATAADKALHKAIEESEKHAQKHAAEQDTVSDEDLKKALEESEKAEKERMGELERQRTEEEIVLEFVKKQSLMEEEHKQRMRQGRDTVGESSNGAGRV